MGFRAAGQRVREIFAKEVTIAITGRNAGVCEAAFRPRADAKIHRPRD
jgi:hypothetical protein